MRKFLAGLVLLAATVLAAPSVRATEAASSAQAMDGEDATRPEDIYRYGLQVKGDNIRVELRVNDVTVLSRILRNGQTVDHTFNEWLRRGRNLVELRIEYFNSKKPFLAGFGVYFQSPTQVANNERTELVANPQSFVLPFRQTINLGVKTIPSLKLWQTDTVALDEQNRRLITSALNELRSRLMRALSESDNYYLATFEKPLRDQVNLAYGRIPESDKDILKAREVLLHKFNKQVNEKVDASMELASEILDFELIGNRQLVRVSRKDGYPLIKVRLGEIEYEVEKAIYGVIAGVWERLR